MARLGCVWQHTGPVMESPAQLHVDLRYNSGMPQPESSQPAARRHFPWRLLLQYRLRTSLIVTTLVAAVLGFWSHSTRPQRTFQAFLKAGMERDVVRLNEMSNPSTLRFRMNESQNRVQMGAYNGVVWLWTPVDGSYFGFIRLKRTWIGADRGF